MEEEGRFHKTYEGTPRSGIISLTLANVCLHYVLDLWFQKVVKKYCKGKAYLARYADDFVACFELKEDADAYYKALINRLAKFNLEVAEDKTRIIYFGRDVYRDFKNDKGSKLSTFDFLGFTHYCSQWLKENRILPIEKLMKRLVIKLNGYFRYYGITDNFGCMNTYRDKVRSLLFKWLNRRSQRKSSNWNKFILFMKQYKLPDYFHFQLCYLYACDRQTNV